MRFLSVVDEGIGSQSDRSMRHTLAVSLVIVTLFSCQKPEALWPAAPVPFTAVHINDDFWAPKIEVNRTVSIPSAFKQCEINGRLDNFALAAGKTTGEHKGDYPFDDTDVHQVIEGASYALAVRYDRQLDAYLDSVITLIAAAQESDGYLYTCLSNKCKRLERWYGRGPTATSSARTVRITNPSLRRMRPSAMPCDSATCIRA